MGVLILDTTTRKIEAKIAGAPATTNPDFVASWADNTDSAFTEGNSNGALNGSTLVDVVIAPAASTRRVIKSITIFNRDTAAVTLTVYYNDNATQRVIFSGTVAAGGTWTTDVTQGLKGDTGATGATGAQGDTGATGAAGPANTVYAESDGSTITFNIDTNGGIQSVTLGGNRTLAVTITSNRAFVLALKQDGTGTRTVTWFSGILWAGGSAPTLTTTINKTDTLGFIRTGSGAYLGFVIGQNS